MAHEVSQTDIIINVAVQLLNIGIFFFCFIKFGGGAISKAIQDKIQKEKKLALADEEYQRLLAEGEKQKKLILDEALEHKNQILAEGKELLAQREQKVLEQAQHEAELILERAQQDARLRQQDMDANFEQGVKIATLSVVKKLFQTQPNVQEEYVQ